MGLSYLHQRGIIHQDLRGNNIIICNDKEIKISDSNLQGLLPLFPHKHTVSIKYGSKKENIIAVKPSSLSIPYENVHYYAPELLKEFIVNTLEPPKKSKFHVGNGCDQNLVNEYAARNKLVLSNLSFDIASDIFAFGT